jgi:hypothetical protein
MMRSSMPPYWCVGSVTCWLNQGVVGKCVGGALLKSPVTIIFDSEFSSLYWLQLRIIGSATIHSFYSKFSQSKSVFFSSQAFQNAKE